MNEVNLFTELNMGFYWFSSLRIINCYCEIVELIRISGVK